MAYASVDSPLGPLVVAATPRGLVRVAYTDRSSPEDVLAELAMRVSPRVLEAPARLDEVRRELDEYFAGGRHEFETPVDWSQLAGFTRKVLRATARIRFGDTGTYAGVATQAGSPRAVRAAGNALGREPGSGRRPLPPRAPHRRCARGLRGRQRAQGVSASARGRLDLKRA